MSPTRKRYLVSPPNTFYHSCLRRVRWIAGTSVKAWIPESAKCRTVQTKKFVYYKADKGTLHDNSSWTPGYTAINFPIIRFADVLLMAAEAEIEVGDPMKARDYVNRVRNRAANAAGFVKDGEDPAANYVIQPYTDTWEMMMLPARK